MWIVRIVLGRASSLERILEISRTVLWRGGPVGVVAPQSKVPQGCSPPSCVDILLGAFAIRHAGFAFRLAAFAIRDLICFYFTLMVAAVASTNANRVTIREVQ